MSLIHRCSCSKNDIISENLNILNIYINYFEYCGDCIEKLKDIFLNTIPNIPICLINIILSFFEFKNMDILNKNYEFISSLQDRNNYWNNNIQNNNISLSLPLVLGWGRGPNTAELPGEIKSYNFVSEILQNKDI